LYPPTSGTLSIDDTQITDANRAWYREHFAVVFSDFHLFDRLLGLNAPDLESRAHHYLRLLQIDHKVGVTGGQLSTIELSQGQKRRLALVIAYLEDRPYYVFDEWAADQDPEYKEIFYCKLLPDFRNRGRGVVVITHDDRYFHLGTRVMKLQNGQMVDTSSRPSAAEIQAVSAAAAR
jgi:putative ATP-binding cassette transporter